MTRHRAKSITLRAKLEETPISYILHLSPSNQSDIEFTLETPKTDPQALSTVRTRTLCLGFLFTAYGMDVAQGYMEAAEGTMGPSYWLKFRDPDTESIDRPKLRGEVDQWIADSQDQN